MNMQICRLSSTDADSEGECIPSGAILHSNRLKTFIQSYETIFVCPKFCTW
jgi:hypothetical protein